MPFYRDRVLVLRPVKLAGYGTSTSWTWDIAKGATLIEVLYPVEFQPQNSLVEQMSDDHTVISVYRLHTPPGKGFPFRQRDRLVYKGEQYAIQGELALWTSADYPSGVDHVEAIFQKVGATDD